MPAVARIDWAEVEPRYRSGRYTFSALASMFACSETAIRNQARKRGWTRDLAPAIKARADEIVQQQALVHTSESNSEFESGGGLWASELTDKDINQAVEQNAKQIACIKIAHRKDIGRLRKALTKLLKEVEQDNRALEYKLKGVKLAADTLETIIKLESESWNFDKHAEPQTEAQQIDPIDGARRLAFILARAEKIQGQINVDTLQ
jgi:tRNA G26 N,N-dimethylase Trm1